MIDGTATVSADGQTVTTDPGSGVTKPGWHGMTPPGSASDGPGDPPAPDPVPTKSPPRKNDPCGFKARMNDTGLNAIKNALDCGKQDSVAAAKVIDIGKNDIGNNIVDIGDNACQLASNFQTFKTSRPHSPAARLALAQQLSNGYSAIAAAFNIAKDTLNIETSELNTAAICINAALDFGAAFLHQRRERRLHNLTFSAGRLQSAEWRVHDIENVH